MSSPTYTSRTPPLKSSVAHERRLRFKRARALFANSFEGGSINISVSCRLCSFLFERYRYCSYFIFIFNRILSETPLAVSSSQITQQRPSEESQPCPSQHNKADGPRHNTTATRLFTRKSTEGAKSLRNIMNFPPQRRFRKPAK